METLNNGLLMELPLFSKRFHHEHSEPYILNILSVLWGFKQKRILWQPSPNPVSLERADLITLATNEYVVGEKTDGIRYTLVCAHWDLPNNKGPFAMLIDRSLFMYELRLKAEERIFQGTVLDGEMVGLADGSLAFVVFDIIADCGISLVNYNFDARQSRLYNILRQDQPKMLSDEESVKLSIYQKNFVPLEMLIEQGSEADPRNFVNHHSDGWIFVPVKCPIQRDRHFTMFKFKEQHTIDLRIIQTDRHQYGLSYKCSGESKFGPFPDPFDESRQLELVFSPDWMKDVQKPHIGGLNVNKIYEFSISEPYEPESINQNRDHSTAKPSHIVCKLIRLRADKDQPNDLFTIKKTIVNNRECMTHQSLLQELSDLKKMVQNSSNH